MIASKKSPHNNFKRLVMYVANPEKAEQIEVHNIPTDDPAMVAERMASTARLNDRVDTRTYHTSISWAPGDDPSDEQMMAVGNRFLAEMGLDEHQTMIAIHRDTDKPHIHIVGNRIHPEDRTAWNGFINGTDQHGKRTIEKTEFQRHEEFTRGMEQEYGWQKVAGKYTGLQREQWGQSLTQGEWHAKRQVRATADALGVDIDSDEVARERANAIKDQLFEASSFEQLDQALGDQGLHIEAKGQGAVFRNGGGYSVKASDVSRQLSGSRLEKRFGQSLKAYCKARDEAVEAMPHERLDRAFSDYFRDQLFEEIAYSADLHHGHAKAKYKRSESYNQEVNGLQRAIISGYNDLYAHPETAKRQLIDHLQDHGFDETMGEVLAKPETFGEVGNREVLGSIAQTYDEIRAVAGRYSNAITSMSNGERRIHIEKNKTVAAAASKIKTKFRGQISGKVTQQMIGKFHGELSKYEGGQAISSGTARSVHLAKLAGGIGKNPKSSPLTIAHSAIGELKNSAKSEGGKAAGRIISRTFQNTKLAMEVVANPAKGLSKLGFRFAQGAMRQAQEASRSMGMGM